MKRIVRYIFVLAIAVLPLTGFAACKSSELDPNLSDVAGVFGATTHQYCSVNSAVVQTITILLSIIAVVSALMLVIGGYQYVMSAGNDDQAKKGRKTITYAIIGLVIAVLAYTIIAIVNRTISSNSSNSANTSVNTNESVTVPDGSGAQ